MQLENYIYIYIYIDVCVYIYIYIYIKKLNVREGFCPFVLLRVEKEARREESREQTIGTIYSGG